MTHGSDGDIISLYTTLPWATLCEEVAKLKIGPRKGTLIALPQAANSGGGDGDLLHPLLQTHRVNEKAPKSRRLESHFDHGGGGNRNLTSDHQDAQSGVIGPEISDASLEPTRAGCNLVESDCSSVVNAPRAKQRTRSRSNSLLPVRNGCAIPTKGSSEPRFWTFSASWREEAHEQRSTLPLYAA